MIEIKEKLLAVFKYEFHLQHKKQKPILIC